MKRAAPGRGRTPSTTPAAPTARGLLDAAALAGGGGLCLATALGFAGRLWWPLDLLAHFRVQYLALACTAAALLLLARRPRAAGVLAACAAVNAAVLLPYLAPRGPDPRPAEASAVSLNVQTANRDFAAVRRYVGAARPDFVVLLEVDEGWLAGLAGLRREYPYGVAEARGDNFGIALLSRRPCGRCGIVRLGEAGLPSVVGEFEVGDATVTLVGTHPLPPLGAEYARLRDDQLRALGDYLAGVRGPRILVGDLNTTPWSAHFRPLLRRAGLRDSGAGRGLARTWPAGSPLPGIAIDHFLASPEVAVVRRERGPDVGSDHFPLHVHFAL